MKILAFAVLLAVMQAVPPVPRKASNPQGSGTQNVANDSQNHQDPSSAHPSAKAQAESSEDQDQGQAESAAEAKQTKVIRESAPVPKSSKDWWDKFYVIFTGGLFVVGAVGVGCAVVTLLAIRRQADVMAEQRQVMFGQLRTMQEQITKMAEQTDVAEKSANAALLNAQAVINTERPLLVVEFKKRPNPAHAGQAIFDISAINYGRTPARVLSAATPTERACISPDNELELPYPSPASEFWTHKITAPQSYLEVFTFFPHVRTSTNSGWRMPWSRAKPLSPPIVSLSTGK